MELDFSDALRIMKRWKWHAVLIVLVVVGTTLLVYDHLPKMYEVSAVLKVSGLSSVRSVLGIPQYGSSSESADDYIEILKSREVIMRAIESGGLVDRLLDEETRKELEEEGFSHEDILEILYRSLLRNLSVSTLGKSSLISVSYRSRDPKLSYDVVQAVVNSFKEVVGNMVGEDIRKRRNFLEEKLNQIYEDYKMKLRKFVDFRKKNGVPSLTSELAYLTRGYVETYMDILSLRTTLEEKKSIIERIKKELSTADPYTDVSNALSVSQSILKLKGELKGLEVIYPADNVNVKAMKARIDFLKGELSKIKNASVKGNWSFSELVKRLYEETTDLEEVRSSLDLKGEVLRGLSSRINEILNLEEDYSYLQTQLSVMESMITFTWQQYLTTLVDEISSVSKIRVVSAPMYSKVPSMVSKKLVGMIGGVVGLLLGFVYVFWRERSHPLVTDHVLFSRKNGLKDFVVVKRKDFNRGVEMIASRLRGERGVFLITGTSEGEGKSRIVLGIAKFLSRGGRRVLIVDGDLKRREVTKRVSEREFDVLSPEDLNFDIPKGYDIVLVDSPPFSESVFDVSLLSSKADGVILVLGEMISKRSDVADLLRIIGSKVRFTVFTNVRWER